MEEGVTLAVVAAKRPTRRPPAVFSGQLQAAWSPVTYIIGCSPDRKYPIILKPTIACNRLEA
jgi:hypothetical protein